MVADAHSRGLMSVQTFLETVQIHRVERLLTRYPKAVDRIFSPEESEYCWKHQRFPHQHFAACFAAKSLIRRVLGGGSLRDIRVTRLSGGMVRFTFAGKASQLAQGHRIRLSLSHEGNLAVAFVAIEATV